MVLSDVHTNKVNFEKEDDEFVVLSNELLNCKACKNKISIIKVPYLEKYILLT